MNLTITTFASEIKIWMRSIQQIMKRKDKGTGVMSLFQMPETGPKRRSGFILYDLLSYYICTVHITN